jgi:probable LLM family oxidoreductase
MQFGAFTFVETRRDPRTGEPVDVDKTFADLLEQIELADRVGLDVFGLGEHHRADYAVSAPAVALAAASARTKRIRLTSAVTVLSSDDPVRVYQQFATLDLISGGRAEIMAGRGSFIESFPLFGHDLNDYDALFAEKLDLLLKIRAKPEVVWNGRHRSPLNGERVYPRALQQPLPVWIASGGTPQSVARAGMLGLPLAIAIIGGEPARFGPLAELYREAGRRAGVAPASLVVGINGHGFLADTTEAAVEAFFPPYAEVMSRIGRERGWPPLTRAQFDQGRGPRGHLTVGTPDEAIAKIIAQHEVFGHERHLMQMQVGVQPQDAILRSIELLGTVVAPKVRAELAKRKVRA